MTRTRRYAMSVIAVFVLAAVSLAGILFLNARPKLGLDLQGGLSVVLTAKGKVESKILDQTVDIIRNRVDSLGAQEPDISRSGSDNIIVQLPGIKDPERALAIIGKTAQLKFRPVLDVLPLSTIDAKATQKKLTPNSAAYRKFVKNELKRTHWTPNTSDPSKKEVVFPSKDAKSFYRLGPAEVVGSDISKATAEFNQTAGWTVQLNLKGNGTKAFGDVTTRLAPQHGQLAIVLDKRVESAPAVQNPITNGQAQITGQFSETEAKDLALVLNTGALPITLERSQVQRVSATLGTAALKSGLIAGAIGLALVALYMFAFYRLLGLITLLGLGLFGSLILGLIGLISLTRGFSLTLAGIAGLIVSVGIAADSYIIYFERVKDELKDGKTFRSAVDRAFASALRTNIAANGVAFLAAIILWATAVGPVRGFALTLGISVVIDIFLLYFYTHPIVALISRRRRAPSMRGVGMGEVVPEPVAASS